MSIFQAIINTYQKIKKRFRLACLVYSNQNIILKGHTNISRTIVVEYDQVKITRFLSQYNIRYQLQKIKNKNNVTFKKMKTNECAIYYIKHNLGNTLP